MKYEWEKRILFILIFVPDAYPMTGVAVFQEPVPHRIGIVENGVVKGLEVAKTIVKVIVSHLRITKRAVIGLGDLSHPFYLRRPVKTGVDQVDLAAGLEIVHAKMHDLLERWEILDGSGKNDAVESLAL
jgi:hypothetical protein